MLTNYDSIYGGKNIDESVNFLLNYTQDDLSWKRINTPPSKPVDLNTIIEAGNYLIDNYLNGPIDNLNNPIRLMIIDKDSNIMQFASIMTISPITAISIYYRVYDNNTSVFGAWELDEKCTVITTVQELPSSAVIDDLIILKGLENSFELKRFDGTSWIDINSHNYISRREYDKNNIKSDAYTAYEEKIVADNGIIPSYSPLVSKYQSIDKEPIKLIVHDNLELALSKEEDGGQYIYINSPTSQTKHPVNNIVDIIFFNSLLFILNNNGVLQYTNVNYFDLKIYEKLKEKKILIMKHSRNEIYLFDDSHVFYRITPNEEVINISTRIPISYKIRDIQMYDYNMLFVVGYPEGSITNTYFVSKNNGITFDIQQLPESKQYSKILYGNNKLAISTSHSGDSVEGYYIIANELAGWFPITNIFSDKKCIFTNGIFVYQNPLKDNELVYYNDIGNDVTKNKIAELTPVKSTTLVGDPGCFMPSLISTSNGKIYVVAKIAVDNDINNVFYTTMELSAINMYEGLDLHINSSSHTNSDFRTRMDGKIDSITMTENVQVFGDTLKSYSDTAISSLGVTSASDDVSSMEISLPIHIDSTFHNSLEDKSKWDEKSDENHIHGVDANNILIGASDINKGVFDIDRIPREMFQNVLTVLTDTERFALTKPHCVNGSVVHVYDPTITPKLSRWYKVKDDTQLSSENGYMEFTNSDPVTNFSDINDTPNFIDNTKILMNTSFGMFCGKDLNNLDQTIFTPVTINFNNIVYANNMFVAVGNEGTILTSTNYKTWKDNSIDKLINLFSIIYVNGMFITVGSSGTILTSTDGITWTKRDSGVTNNLRSITYGNGMFITVGEGGTILTSTDGITWIKRTNSDVNHLYSIAYANGMFITVGDTGTILTSTDGITWVKRTSGVTTYLNSISYDNGMFVTVGNSGNILTSTDGATWTKRTITYNTHLYSITYGNGMFVTVGSTGIILTSTDGITWTKRTSGTTNSLRSITYDNGMFITVGEYGIILTSTDGITWDKPEYIDISFMHITYANGMFITVGSNGTILTSNDSITWTKRTSGVTTRLQSITYANGMFITVGMDGTILTSTDGITWVKRTIEVTNRLLSITYANGMFITVGDTGTILTSNDSITWNKRTSGVTNGLQSITYGNGMFITVGMDGTILTSTDGITWDKRTNSDVNHLYSINYNNGMFITVGEYGTILTSTDGITWVKRTSEATNRLLYITYGNDMFIIVGRNGTILTSTDGIMWTKMDIINIKEYDIVSILIVSGYNITNLDNKKDLDNKMSQFKDNINSADKLIIQTKFSSIQTDVSELNSKNVEIQNKLYSYDNINIKYNEKGYGISLAHLKNIIFEKGKYYANNGGIIKSIDKYKWEIDMVDIDHRPIDQFVYGDGTFFSIINNDTYIYNNNEKTWSPIAENKNDIIKIYFTNGTLFDLSSTGNLRKFNKKSEFVYEYTIANMLIYEYIGTAGMKYVGQYYMFLSANESDGAIVSKNGIWWKYIKPTVRIKYDNFVFFNNKYYTIVDKMTLYESDNLQDWKVVIINEISKMTNTIINIKVVNNKLFLIGNFTNNETSINKYLLYTSDVKTWTMNNEIKIDNEIIHNEIHEIIYNNIDDEYCMLSKSEEYTRLLFSKDLVSWEVVGDISYASTKYESRIVGCIYANNSFKILGVNTIYNYDNDILHYEKYNGPSSSIFNTAITYDLIKKRFIVLRYNNGIHDFLVYNNRTNMWENNIISNITPASEKYGYNIAISSAGIYLVLAENTAYVSNDYGFTWTTHTTPYSNVTKLITGNGVFIFIDKTTGKIYNSSNGRDWVISIIDGTAGVLDVIYDGNKFITFTGGFIYTSIDAITWSKYVYVSSAENMAYLEYNDGVYFILNSTSQIILYSTNLSVWNIVDVSKSIDLTTDKIISMVYSDDGYLHLLSSKYIYVKIPFSINGYADTISRTGNIVHNSQLLLNEANNTILKINKELL